MKKKKKRRMVSDLVFVGNLSRSRHFFFSSEKSSSFYFPEKIGNSL